MEFQPWIDSKHDDHPSLNDDNSSIFFFLQSAPNLKRALIVEKVSLLVDVIVDTASQKGWDVIKMTNLA